MLDYKKKAITEHWQFCPKCIMAMARCSVLTVHIQSAVHPIVL